MAAILLAGVGHADMCKVSVSRTGLQCITGRQLAEAGVDLAAIDPEALGLRHGEDAVAVRLTGLEAGRLTDGSQVVFFGEALDTRYTDTNVYWLSWDGRHVARMEEPEIRPATGEPTTSLPALLRLEENKRYAYLLWAPDEGVLRPWIWADAKPGAPLTVSFDLPNLAEGAVGLRVAVRGRTLDRAVDPDHHVVVEVNGGPVSEARFDGQALVVVEATLPAGVLKQAGNELTLSCPGDTEAGDRDRASLDWLQVTYSHDLTVGGPTVFEPVSGAAGGVVAQVEGADSLDWYDITDPLHPSVTAGIPAVDGAAAVGLGGEPGRRYAAVPVGMYEPVASVTPVAEPYLRKSELTADYIIIAHESLVDATEALAEYRRSQGLRVVVVPVGEIYSEFSDGIFTPVAVRDFLRHAHSSWEPKPRYVLLVGDATHDYRDFTGSGFRCLVPSMTVRERGGVEIACDRAFTTFPDSDGRSAMAVGRLPAQTPEQVAAYVRRVIAYEKRPSARQAIFAGDQEGFGPAGPRFTRLCQGLAAPAATKGWQVSTFYQTDVGLTEEMPKKERVGKTRETLTPKLVEALLAGADLTFFAGHGDEVFWGYYKLLQVGDLPAGQAARSGICVQETCFGGGWDLPGGKESISESLLWSGACVATYTPSRLGGNDVQLALARALIEGREGTIGELLMELGGSRVLLLKDSRWASGANYNLLGDPALKLAQ